MLFTYEWWTRQICVTFKFDRWAWNCNYSPKTPNLGQIQQFFGPCDLEIWWMILKNNRVPLWKRLSWVVTSVILTFDPWPWPFAWTPLLWLAITPENFMMIQWWEHSEKGVTDRQTDRWTDGWTEPFIELLGLSSKLKYQLRLMRLSFSQEYGWYHIYYT